MQNKNISLKKTATATHTKKRKNISKNNIIPNKTQNNSGNKHKNNMYNKNTQKTKQQTTEQQQHAQRNTATINKKNNNFPIVESHLLVVTITDYNTPSCFLVSVQYKQYNTKQNNKTNNTQTKHTTTIHDTQQAPQSDNGHKHKSNKHL